MLLHQLGLPARQRLLEMKAIPFGARALLHPDTESFCIVLTTCDLIAHGESANLRVVDSGEARSAGDCDSKGEGLEL